MRSPSNTLDTQRKSENILEIYEDDEEVGASIPTIHVQETARGSATERLPGLSRTSGGSCGRCL